ncbi:replication initiator protein A [Butyrivibrio sp. INlla16]|uniref:replication initiator protein A n=1 Tax=Butyrivibrio sp. INlla16 TaxID=1520807 RepID=UPI00088FD9C3|nr:replication initiator protein A [Butyrivibrio sp. INlla16]SDB52302.1 Replication initiator protein A (RepA) N-terminus [Butyrivibrio sp. INlla16]
MMDYFYNTQAEQFASVEIPKALLTGKSFSSLSAPSKILYAVLLDKMGEAKRHNWFDDENRVYVLYPLSKLEDDINFSRHTIIDCMTELEEFGLIYKLQVKGKPSKIYVKNFNRRRRFQMIG